MKRLASLFCILLLLTGCTPEPSEPPTYDFVVIAMLDTGISTKAIDSKHLLKGYNYVTNSFDTEDRINHGTATASIIVGSESAEVQGLAPEAVLIPLVVTDRVDGETRSVSPEILARAIRDAVDVYGAPIINVSLGIKKEDEAVRLAVEYAHQKGALLISAVGNEGADGSSYYPAAYETVLGVGSHDRNGKVSSFSQQNGTADLLAPGEELSMASRNGKPYGAKGTSYATAYVSAVAALLLDQDSSLSSRQLRQALIERAEDVGPSGWDSESGYGILPPPQRT